MLKLRVSREFQLPNGDESPRASMDDLTTFHQRIFGRIRDIMGDEAAISTANSAVNAYNSGKYDEALKHFRKALKITSAIEEEIYPHLIICQRVVAIEKNYEDGRYEQRLSSWESSLFRRFRASPQMEIRCKYCGHYTRYIDPDQGLAYFGTNNCDHCFRGYPAPDFVWDSLDGQAYIYYRRSVSEEEFYEEFEELFDVEKPSFPESDG